MPASTSHPICGGGHAHNDRQLQLIPQDSTGSLNPRRNVAASIARPLRTLAGLDRGTAQAGVQRFLDQVRLPADVAGRYPRDLSGGQRQ